MPDSNTQTTVNPTSTSIPEPVSDSPVVVPEGPIADALQAAKGEETDANITEVASKIAEAQNILIALSSDPSVDELSAAIGLSLYLDKLGKRATAIYSGTTPNALEFLKPEETFENSADTLQDFVIALNKDKADHLRYKLDGDYVKIYITPYKSRIAEDDLGFSYGDFNIDLVIALDVANGIDLDSALREHGRIMHDAVIVNITTGAPGKLGEIEWSDKSASSVSEMVAKLLYGIKSDIAIEKDEATAFLTGIVAATNSFSNASTTSETMKVSAKLMESGADQQLIAKNITPETENEIMSYASVKKTAKKKPESSDPTNLEIDHEEEETTETIEEPKEEISEEPVSEPVAEEPVAEEPISEVVPEPAPEPEPEPTPEVEPEEPKDPMLDDLQAAAAGLSTAGDVATPVATESPLRIETSLPPVSLPEPTAPAMAMSEPVENTGINQSEEMTIAPAVDFSAEAAEGENKYGQMLEEALAEDATPVEVNAPIINPADNPATSFAPSVPSVPEINGVPEINYMPMPGDESIPMPTTPPVDFGAPTLNIDPTSMPPMPTLEAPAAPEVPSPVEMGGQPAMQDQVYNQQAANPGAFQIPGM